MTPDRWPELKAWFVRVTEATGSERDSLIHQVQNERPELWPELKRLLDDNSQAQQFLEEPVELARRLRAQSSAPPADGEVLVDRFEIRRCLGEGGMGRVFEAFDRQLSTTVALKTLHERSSSRDEAQLAREVLAARSITHPNVCRVFDYGCHQSARGPVPFFTMELLRGETLAQRLERDGKIPEAEARQLAEEMAAALDSAHHAQLVHRDFKPANVFLNNEGGKTRAVVTDFGLARAEPGLAQESMRTETGELRGTFSYMAPEVLAGNRATAASDIYSFGLVLYEMTTGVRPFERGNPFASAIQRATASVDPPRKHNPALSAEWEHAVLACLHQDPALRPKKASEAWTPSRRRIVLPRPKKLALAASIVVTIGLLASFPTLRRYLVRGAPLAPGTAMLIGDIQNLTGDSELNATGLLLRQQLTQSAYLDVMDRGRIADALARMGKAGQSASPDVMHELALREGAQLVLSGNLTRLGRDLELRLRIERMGASPDSVIGHNDRSWPVERKEQLMETVRAAAEWVRESAGESKADIGGRDRPPQDVTTSSWQALQSFEQAEALYAQGKTEDAIGLLKEAVRLDPEFALAFMRVGDIRLGQRLYDEGEEYWQKALSILDHRKLAEREELRIRAMYAGDTGNFRECERIYRTFALRFPNDWYARWKHGLLLASVDRLEEAADELHQAERLRPGLRLNLTSLLEVYLWSGNFVEAKATAEKLRTMGETGWADATEAQVALLNGDLAAARKGFESAASAREGLWRIRGPMMLACFDAELGRYAEAAAVLDRSIQRDRDAGQNSDIGERLLARAQMESRMQTREKALMTIEEALAVERGAENRARAGVLLARLGKIDRARAIRKSFGVNQKFGVNATAPHLIDGEIALFTGQTEAAIAAFQKAHEFETPSRHQEPLARAMAKAGRNEEALALYRQMLARPGHFWYAPDYDWLGLWMDTARDAALLAKKAGNRGMADEISALYERMRGRAPESQ